MTTVFRVVEIFDSIEGEGRRAGLPATFIRLEGCNLRCSFCDTAYSYSDGCYAEHTLMDLSEIIEKVNVSYMRVTLTGGEPLVHPEVERLVVELILLGCEVNIETNGSVDLIKFRELSDDDRLFFTVDYKLPCSGVEEKMHLPNFFSLRKYDVLKFVVGTENDVRKMIEFVSEMKEKCIEMPQVYVSAVFRKMSLQRLADVILNTPVLSDARLQLQLHKYVWNPDERGV